MISHSHILSSSARGGATAERRSRFFARRRPCRVCEKRTYWLEAVVYRPQQQQPGCCDTALFCRCNVCHSVHVYWQARAENFFFEGDEATLASQVLLSKSADARERFFRMLEIAEASRRFW